MNHHISEDAQRGQQTVVNLAEVLVQGTARILDLQATATRTFLQTQSRSAAMLGAPDWSPLFNGRNGEELSHLFSASAEQAVEYLRQTNAAWREVQQQFTDLLDQQTQQFTEQMRKGMEEVGRRGQEEMDQLRRAAMQTASAAERTGRDAVHTTEQAAASANQGAERTPIIATPSEPGLEERSRSKRTA